MKDKWYLKQMKENILLRDFDTSKFIELNIYEKS